MRPHIKAKRDQWRRQAAALDADVYRLTLIPRGEGKPFNVGKAKDGTERFFSAVDVEGYITSGMLAARNARGYDVYVTPIDSTRHYIVVDDSDEKRLKALQGETGARPVWVQESSPANLQAVFVARKPQASKAEQSAANSVVVDLNRRFGDPHFSAVVHPFRVTGFSNAKPQYDPQRRPIVRPRLDVIETAPAGTPDPQIEQLIEQYRSADPPPSDPVTSTSPRGEVEGAPGGALAEAFREERQAVCEWAQERGWEPNGSKLDYHAAGALFLRGFTDRDIVGVIANDPDVGRRHHDPMDYARRTVDAIMGDLADARSSTHDAYRRWRERRKDATPTP